MKNPFEVGKTSPLLETLGKATEAVLNFTPVDLPTYKPEYLTGMLLANFDFGGAAIKTFSFHCPSCGNQSGKADLFCIGCGEFLDLNEAETVVEEIAIPAVPVCEDCGAEIAVDEIFCMTCGSVISDY